MVWPSSGTRDLSKAFYFCVLCMPTQSMLAWLVLLVNRYPCNGSSKGDSNNTPFLHTHPGTSLRPSLPSLPHFNVNHQNKAISTPSASHLLHRSRSSCATLHLLPKPNIECPSSLPLPKVLRPLSTHQPLFTASDLPTWSPSNVK